MQCDRKDLQLTSEDRSKSAEETKRNLIEIAASVNG